MVFVKLPFTGMDRPSLYDMIKNKEPTYSKDDLKLVECNNFDSLIDLMQKLLIKDPSKRMNMIEMQTHPWITENNTVQCDWKNDVEYVDFEKPTE
jgi:serine/threonine protein kinase